MSHSKRKTFLFFFALKHTLFVSRRRQHFAFSSLTIFSKMVILYSLLLYYRLKGGNTLLSPSSCVPPKQKSLYFYLGFTLYFSSPQREDPQVKAKAKANKFFVALSIYKTFFIFPFELRIYYFFNKE